MGTKDLTYDVFFNDDNDSNNKGFEYSLEDARAYIDAYNGTNESYFEDYKGGTVSVVCNETEETVFETRIKTKQQIIMKTIETFLSELNTEIDVLNLIDIDNIDYSDAFYSIYEMIDDNGGFNVDIIYYSSAIDYLSKNDPSLRDSLEIALDMGFSLNAINSEVLASLLASQDVREDFYELKDEINNFFLELEEE